MKKALVTGSRGYIGRRLVDTLILNQWDVYEFDHKDENKNDINGSALDRLFDNIKFDVVFHLAAVSNVLECAMDVRKTYLVNTVASIKIHELCKLHGARFVFISSESVLGMVQTSYSMSKFAVEYETHESNDAIIIRLPNVIGSYPGYEFKERPSLFENLMLNVLDNKPLIINGDAWRGYSFIDDVVYDIIRLSMLDAAKTTTLEPGLIVNVETLIKQVEMFTGSKIKYSKHVAIDPQGYHRGNNIKVNYQLIEKAISSYKT